MAVVSQGSGSTTFEVTVPGIESSHVTALGREFTRLSMAGAGIARLETGRPEVPVIPVMLAVPTGADVAVEVLDVRTGTVKTGPVYPLQDESPVGQPAAAFQYSESHYLEAGDYPPTWATALPVARFGDLAVVCIQVYPVRVDVARKTADVATSLRIRASYNGGTYPTAVPAWLWRTYANIIDNFGAAGFVPTDGRADAVKLLVFRHSNYGESQGLARLLDWTEQRGYRVRVITADWLTPRQIQDSILAQYGPGPLHDLRWVLLVGNAREVPLYPWAVANASFLGDYAYSDLTPGCPDSLDWFPDIGIGRFSPSSVRDLDRQAEKVLAYEQQPATGSDWFNRMALVAGRDTDSTDICVARMRQVESMPMRYSNWQRDLYRWRDGSASDLSAAVNSGAGALIYFGHGNPEYWAWPGSGRYWGGLEIGGLDNSGKTPVVFQVACGCADISNSACVSRQWMSKWPGGAVASLGYTGLVYGRGVNVEGFARALGDDSVLGVCSAPAFDVGAVSVYAAAWESKWARFKANTLGHLLLGAPAMPVWIGGTPARPFVRLPPVIPPDRAFSLCCTVLVCGRPVEGALVCAWRKGDRGYYLTGRTDSSGVARLDIANTGPASGEVLVTVSEGHAEHSRTGAAHMPTLPCTEAIPVGYGAWVEAKALPAGDAFKPAAAGAWLVTDAGTGFVYAAKGNKSGEFYAYSPVQNDWVGRLAPIPAGPLDKLPYRGCRGISDGGNGIYMTKGNNTLEFWYYDIALDTWTRRPDVPAGAAGKAVKDGCGLAYVLDDSDTGWVYAIKGGGTEFCRYNVNAERWDALADVPYATAPKYGPGSFLVYDDSRYLYAHQAKYTDSAASRHYMFRYDVAARKWSETLPGMPVSGKVGGKVKDKKSKDGGAGAWSGGALYALKGGNTCQFYCFVPATGLWTELDTIASRGSTGKKKLAKAGASLAAVGAGGIFALKGNKTSEFWQYVMPTGAQAQAQAQARSGAQASSSTIYDVRFSISPNPLTVGFATIRYAMPKAGPMNVKVLDVVGRAVFRQSAIGNRSSTMSLDLRELSNGVYLVQVDADGNNSSQKLVVQR